MKSRVLSRSACLYILSGVRLRSNVALAEFPPCDRASTRKPVVRSNLTSPRTPLCARSARWFHRTRNPDGRIFLIRGRIDSGYLLRFPGYADFIIRDDGRDITCAPVRDGISSSTVRHLLLDHVMPLVLNLLGRDAIHASAVLHNGLVCAFAGDAGAGKSTLAASLVETGAGYFADDCLALEQSRDGIIALPAYQGVRLWKNSAAAIGLDEAESTIVAEYTSKVRLTRGNFAPSPAPLGAVYFVQRHRGRGSKLRGIELESLSGSDAVVRLVEAAYRLDISDSVMLARQFGLLSEIAKNIPLRRLLVPNDIQRLRDVRRAIIDDLDRCRTHDRLVSYPLALGMRGR